MPRVDGEKLLISFYQAYPGGQWKALKTGDFVNFSFLIDKFNFYYRIICMKNSEVIFKQLSENYLMMKKVYKVSKIGLFGSYINNQQNEKSDVDILVSFYGSITLFDFIRLKNYLSELLGTNVDLVMEKALKPEIGRKILSEVRYVA